MTAAFLRTYCFPPSIAVKQPSYSRASILLSRFSPNGPFFHVLSVIGFSGFFLEAWPRKNRMRLEGNSFSRKWKGVGDEVSDTWREANERQGFVALNAFTGDEIYDRCKVKYERVMDEFNRGWLIRRILLDVSKINWKNSSLKLTDLFSISFFHFVFLILSSFFFVSVFNYHKRISLTLEI